jgi:hypothetical protein
MSTTILSSAAAGPANNDMIVVTTINFRMLPKGVAYIGGPPDASVYNISRRGIDSLDLDQPTADRRPD